MRRASGQADHSAQSNSDGGKLPPTEPILPHPEVVKKRAINKKIFHGPLFFLVPYSHLLVRNCSLDSPAFHGAHGSETIVLLTAMPPSTFNYSSLPELQSSVVKEEHIEYGFIGKLQGLKYEYRPDINNRATLQQNFREKFEALNRVRLTDAEFARL